MLVLAAELFSLWKQHSLLDRLLQAARDRLDGKPVFGAVIDVAFGQHCTFTSWGSVIHHKKLKMRPLVKAFSEKYAAPWTRNRMNSGTTAQTTGWTTSREPCNAVAAEQAKSCRTPLGKKLAQKRDRQVS